MSEALNALAAKVGVSHDEALAALVELGHENPTELVKRCSTYRKRRKYTVLTLSEHVTAEGASRLRDAIGSSTEGPLLASELIAFLRTQEAIIPEWKRKRLPPPDGVPRKRGRPRKRQPNPAG